MFNIGQRVLVPYVSYESNWNGDKVIRVGVLLGKDGDENPLWEVLLGPEEFGCVHESKLVSIPKNASADQISALKSILS